MAKYSTEFKMKVVKEYLEGNISYPQISDKYCIPSETIIRKWVNAYKSQGYEGLKVKIKNTQYTLEFKLNVQMSTQKWSTVIIEKWSTYSKKLTTYPFP